MAGMAAATMVGAAVSAAPSASAAELTPFTIGGAQTRLSTATGSAPELTPGLYHDSLPLDTAHHYAKVTRQAGESLTVTVSGAPTEKGSPYVSTAEHALTVALVLPDGTSCAQDQQSISAKSSLKLLSATAALDAAKSKRDSYQSKDCMAATSFLVDITRTAPTDGGALPVELLMTREPKTSGSTGSPAPVADLSAIQALPKEATASIDPGHGFSDAPTVTTGNTTNVALTLGDTIYYKVRVGWGQRLAASVELPRNGSNFAMQVDTASAISIYSPQRVLLDPNSSSKVSESTTMFAKDGATKTIGSYTAPIAWANRDLDYSASGDVGSDAAQWATAAGWYYVAVRTAPYDSATSRTDLAAIPARLTVIVTGTAGQGPTYVDAGGQAISQPAPGEVSAGGQESSSFPWVAVGGSAVVVLLAAGAVLWALRQRRRPG